MSGVDRSLPPPAARERAAYRAALALVHERHEGRLDPAGLPQPEHFERVAARLLRLCPDATDAQLQAALLHDAFEPGGVAQEKLEQIGVLAEAIRIIRHITLPTDQREYLEYSCELARLGDAAAVQVKLADNLDAVDLLRADGSAASRKLLDTRYLPSCAVLANALGTRLDLFI